MSNTWNVVEFDSTVFSSGKEYLATQKGMDYFNRECNPVLIESGLTLEEAFQMEFDLNQ